MIEPGIVKPTKGRIVDYRQVVGSESVVSPAMVIWVREDEDREMVDLLVHGRYEDFRVYNVSRGDDRGQWQWPTRV